MYFIINILSAGVFWWLAHQYKPSIISHALCVHDNRALLPTCRGAQTQILTRLHPERTVLS